MINEKAYEEFVEDFTNKMYNLKTDIPFSDYIFYVLDQIK